MMHPVNGIGPVAALEPLHLALAQMQQAGGFAYAQPPACRIFHHSHSLQLFLTHRHHPCRVTESRCSYGVTLSWSIYRGFVRTCAPATFLGRSSSVSNRCANSRHCAALIASTASLKPGSRARLAA